MIRLSEDTTRGVNSDGSNLFNYENIIINFPRMASYDPSKPKVYKWNTK